MEYGRTVFRNGQTSQDVDYILHRIRFIACRVERGGTSAKGEKRIRRIYSRQGRFESGDALFQRHNLLATAQVVGLERALRAVKVHHRYFRESFILHLGADCSVNVSTEWVRNYTFSPRITNYLGTTRHSHVGRMPGLSSHDVSICRGTRHGH